MAEVDTSSYGLHANTPGPLDMVNKLTTLQGAANQNKLFQQEFQSKLALSKIYKDAMNPDGTVDFNRVNNLIGADPNVSYGIPQAVQNSQEAQQRNINIDTSKLENAQKHLQAMAKFIGPLATGKPTANDVAMAMAGAVQQGFASPDEASKFWAQLPRGQDGKIDENQLPAFAQRILMQTMSASEQIAAMMPAPTMVNNGQSQIPVRLPQIGQPSIAGPAIQNQLPPSTPIFNQQTNAPGYLGPQDGGQGNGAGGAIQSGPALGAESAANVDAQAGAQQGVSLQTAADQVPQNKAVLGNLLGALDQFTSGPGQDWKKVAAAFANANLPEGLGFDPKKIASQEEFNKQAEMLAQNQFKALGGTGTDAKLDSASLTSPNSELSKLGNKGIISMLKGNEDAIAVKNRAWQEYKQANGPQSYGKFSTEFNKLYNPRVFQSQYLTPEDNKKMLAGMNKDEQKAFLNSYRYALENGWVKLPGSK